MIDIPLGLRIALESGECVLFIGSGIGNNLLDQDGNKAPNAKLLAEEMAKHFSIDAGGIYDLPQISKIVEIRKGRVELEKYLQKRLSNLIPDKHFQWLSNLRWKSIFTTNYDRGIQRAYELNPKPPQKFITISSSPNLVSCKHNFEIPIYHLHGSLFDSTSSHIIITEDDYSHYTERRASLFNILKTEFATSCVLYIGYANHDPNWKIVLDEMTREFFPSSMPYAYRISPDTSPLDKEILKDKNIETIEATFEEFAQVASAIIPNAKDDFISLDAMRATIPKDLIKAFEKNPQAVVRLLASWTYVNAAPFHEKSNIRSFLRGDRPNWALVAGNQDFERDIETACYDDMLDYATSSSNRPHVSIILGSAGYGVTTFIMSLAARVVKDRAAAVFMLKPGCSIIEGDIEFATICFPDRPFFFIDNAADFCTTLESIIQNFRDTNKSSMFILGERLNEWRQCHGRVRGKEYELEPLSDPEIYRLIDCLAKYGELNKLEHLSPELQFNAIKVNYRKELLVAMREATEGKSFDAILEDEFRNIRDSTSRQLYLTVCCFYQHGAYLRDKLLADLMDMPLEDIYRLTKDATDGVVIYDTIDENKGSYSARARHRIIAAIVWERCGSTAQREQLLQLSLSKLNLNYKSDHDAFECFIRSDRLIDSIRTLDGKTRFFEKACQKDPESPFVRQHYARMLSREKKPDIALNQIQAAIDMNSRIRVLHHTKGIILTQMALDNESQEIARRRLAQAESSFRQALSMNRRDEYSFQGLAQLYLGWAQRASTLEEATAYIAKAEDTINEGLRSVRVRDALWIESANIQRYLGDNPSRLKALEKAVNDTPTSIVAGYLLGRAYRKEGRFADALKVLDPIIKDHPTEFRSFVEYSLCLLHEKKSYAEAIAILDQSTLYGYSDPRFIATLGGMLFMNKSFSKAENVFLKSADQNFTSAELNTIQFRPINFSCDSMPLSLEGKVVRVKIGFSFIESAGYPDFLCPGSKYKGVILQEGLKITFEPAFCAKGPIADHPKAE